MGSKRREQNASQGPGLTRTYKGGAYPRLPTLTRSYPRLPDSVPPLSFKKKKEKKKQRGEKEK